jgi:hypothetical protein
LFITGCPKSGTTWLSTTLNGHPQVVAAGEGRFAWRLFPLIQQAGGIFNTDQKTNGASEQAYIYDGELRLVMRSLSESVFLRYLVASGKPPNVVRVLADKTPQHILSVPLAKNDPRPKEKYVESFITESWRLHVEAAVAAEQRLGSSVILNVRYEDMHRDDRGIIRRCLEHIDVDASESSIEACAQSGSFEKLSGGRKRGQTDSKSFYRSGTVGDWQNHLDPDLARRCCHAVKNLMDRFGYEIDAAPQVAATVAA